MKTLSFGICAVAACCLLLSQSSAQSLGEVARATRTSKKATRVVTNDNLPEAKGPANGAATMPATQAAANMEVQADTTNNPQQQANPKEELQEEIKFLDGQIAETNAKIEVESNEAVRETMERLVVSYQDRRNNSQQRLDDLQSSDKKNRD